MKGDKFTILTILIVIIAAIVALYAVFSLAWGIMKSTVGGLVENVVTILEPKPEIDYNFDPSDTTASDDSQDDSDEEDNDDQDDDDDSKEIVLAARILNEGEVINYAFNIPKREGDIQTANLPAFDDILKDAQAAELNGSYSSSIPQTNVRLQIPKIGIDSPVWQGAGADQLLKQGFWIYPGSANFGQGEVTMLCHRRYFGTEDPRTCWFLDQVVAGDKVYLNFADSNSVYEYEIVGTNIFEANDPSIYNISPTEDSIRLVTCTPLYSNTHRLVVLAKRVK